MIKRFLLAGVASLVVIAAAAAGSTTGVQAQSSGGGNTTANNSIWCGLWAGVNLNFTTECSRENQGSQVDRPAPAPANGTKNRGANTGIYAALGDSVAAGAGLPPSSGVPDAQCGRSHQAYPHQVAQARGLSLVHAACSGATAGDLFTKQRVRGPNIPAQLSTAFNQGTPQLITITAGANDVHWDDFLRACYASNCSTDTSTTAANTYLSILQWKLHYLFQDIAARSGGSPPTVVITGYYNPVSNQCINRQDYISPEEIVWLNNMRDALNQTIRDTSARYNFARFAPVNFSGHTVCSSDPWVQGLNDPAPFHPNAAGQRAIADSVLQAL